MAARKKRPMMTLNITQDLSVASNSTRILPWIVLAGCEATTDRSTLEQLGASFILNASSEIKSWFEDDDKFQYLRVPIEDEPTCDARSFFASAHAFCEGVRARHLAGERVGLVVHCKTGMSRSSTMLLSHLMQARGVRGQVAQVTGRTDCLGAGCPACRAQEAAGGPAAVDAACANHGMTLRDALSFIRERRPRASPNAGFMAQLVELEGQLYGGTVTIDLDKYRLDRFGDVRTFCIGEIDPLVGYTGLAAVTAAAAAAATSPLISDTTSGAADSGSARAAAALQPGEGQAFPINPAPPGSEQAPPLPPRRRLSIGQQQAAGITPVPPPTSQSSVARPLRGFGCADADADGAASPAAASPAFVPPLALAPAPAAPLGQPVRRPSRLNALDVASAAAPASSPGPEGAAGFDPAARAMAVTPSTLLPALEQRRRPSFVDPAAVAAAAGSGGSGGLPALGGAARRLSGSSTGAASSSGRALLQPLAGGVAARGAPEPAAARSLRAGVLPGLQSSPSFGDAAMADSQ